MQILPAGAGQRPVADNAVLGVEDDLLVAEIVIRAQGRNADPEIDDPAVLELHRQPVAHLLPGQPLGVAHRALLSASYVATSAGRIGHKPSGGDGTFTRRCT